MKTFNILKYLLLFSLVFLFAACNDEDLSEFDDAVDPSSLNWQASTNFKVTPTEGKEVFVWLKDVFTLQEYWGNDTIELNMQLNSAHPFTDFEKIEFYLFAFEESGYNSADPYDTSGKLISTISEIPETGILNLAITTSEVVSLYESDFQNPRPTAPLLDNDLFILQWVITHNDGSKYDSRKDVDFGTSRGLTVEHNEFTPPGFVGTFDYEWIEATDEAISYGDITIGTKGTQTFELTDVTGVIGTSTTDNLMFGYYYGGPGSVTLNYDTGETIVIDDSWRAQKWNIRSIDGPSMEIELEYKYSAGYNEYGTVKVTRTDGNDWPENIYQPQASPWGGTFDYEWLEVSAGAAFDKSVGDTGSISGTDLADGQWTISNLLFDYYYGSAGVLTYDAVTGLTSVEGSDDAVWTISNVTATTIDIAWTYYYTASYNESGTVRLSRTDGKEWPLNIYTE